MSEANNSFVEQRKYLRLNASDIGQIICAVPVSPEQTVELDSTDISPGGFGALIPENQVKNFPIGSEFSRCRINLPSLDEVSIRLVGLWQAKKKSGEQGTFAGFEFISALDWLSTGLESCMMPD